MHWKLSQMSGMVIYHLGASAYAAFLKIPSSVGATGCKKPTCISNNAGIDDFGLGIYKNEAGEEND